MIMILVDGTRSLSLQPALGFRREIPVDGGNRWWAWLGSLPDVCFGGIYDWSDKTISLAADGLNEAGGIGIVFQGLADLADGGVDAVVGVEEDILTPDALDNLFPTDDLATFFDQKQEHRGRDAFEFEDTTAAGQLIAAGVKLDSFAQFDPVSFQRFQRHNAPSPSGSSIVPRFSQTR
jgi:hypothetical protein